MKHRRFLGAVIAALCLSAVPASAQDTEPCLSRPSIQQKLLPLIVPLQDAITSVATGEDQADAAQRKLAEVYLLIEEWRTAPAGVNGCWRRGR